MKKSISTDLTQENIAAAIAILTATPGQMVTLSAGLSPEQLRVPLGEGERSLTEDMAHLIKVEAVSSEAIYLALMLNNPLLHDVHSERDLGRLLRLDRFDFSELLAYFTFRRKILLGVLNALTDAQWTRTIRENGKQRQESVYWRVRGLALHEQSHVTDLQTKLKKR
jgi:hypothetical protein